MNPSNLAPPTFQLSGQNLTLSYAGQTASAPVSQTAGGQSATAYVQDDSGDSASVNYDISNQDQVNFTEAITSQGSDTLTSVQVDPQKGATVTQTEFDVLTGDITTVKIKPDGHGGYTVTRTDDNQNGVSAYDSDGQASSGQSTASTNSLIKNLFA